MTGKSCCGVCKIVGLLVAVGALNWGLVALFQLNLVERALGMGTAAKVVYIVIGIAGLLKLISFVKPCPCCSSSGTCGSSK